MPYVVLAGWQGHYENAVRTEWLSTGVYANKLSALGVAVDELSVRCSKSFVTHLTRPRQQICPSYIIRKKPGEEKQKRSLS